MTDTGEAGILTTSEATSEKGSSTLEPGPKVLIIIPFYRAVDYAKQCIESLVTCKDELIRTECSVLMVNDSPDDHSLEQVLQQGQDRLGHAIACTLLRNEVNLGFVRSVNRALQRAIQENRDALIVNADTVLFPGAVTELRTIASIDPMIGFASPRSNNATICSLPHENPLHNVSPEQGYDAFKRLSQYLPRFHYACTAVGFCLYIKVNILKEFGIFDEVFGMGYNEENDLICRANRCGYRAVIANHAFVYHKGTASFSVAENTPKHKVSDPNSEILDSRYPEYRPAVQRYCGSPFYEAEEKLTGLLPDSNGRLSLLFDASHLPPTYNGTVQLAHTIIHLAGKHWTDVFNLSILCPMHTREFHGFNELAHVTLLDPVSQISKRFAAVFRIGQPFDLHCIRRISSLGAVNVYFMLDAIAMDCNYLDKDLHALWNHVFSYADGVIYNSHFTQEQFRRRFDLSPHVRELVSYHSLDFREYRDDQSPSSSEQAGEHILVIGNAFHHKFVEPTLRALSGRFPNERIVVLGTAQGDGDNVKIIPSGHLSNSEVDRLFLKAKFVVFPSHYEGFGFPVVKTMAFSKPIMARDLNPSREIKELLGSNQNIILYSSTEELIAMLSQGFPEWDNRVQYPDGLPDRGWERSADEIKDFLFDVIGNCTLARTQARIKALRTETVVVGVPEVTRNLIRRGWDSLRQHGVRHTWFKALQYLRR